MPLTIAIIGTGPTGIYAFRSLMQHEQSLAIWLFEKGEKAGIGLPYSPETSSKTMLANIASIEIPDVISTYLDWLERQPPARLRGYGLDPDDLDARQFTPRLLLGEYFRDQLMDLVDTARARGHSVTLCEATEVADVAVVDGLVWLTTDAGPLDQGFDRVMLATGHVFPDEAAATRSYFPSPWSGLIEADVAAGKVGILGTSLSGIDAAMAVASQHGRFAGRGQALRFVPDADGLKITLMSWTGVLPEADFYCPIPYDPLLHMTPAALEQARGAESVLDAVYALFQAELAQADPAYARAIGLDRLTPDSFTDAYFAEREAHDPFHWARENLAEVEHNKAHRITVPWRYAILRMHEQVEDLVPDFSDADRKRFDCGLKSVFVDNYAAVPSESIHRLLALRDAGVLGILALGQDYTLNHDGAKTVIVAKGETHVFDTFIDARGQKALTTKDLPFPTLRKAMLDAGCEIPEVDEDYILTDPATVAGRIGFGAIPYLMHDRPFAQGITAAADIGAAMARSIREDAQRSARRRRRWA
ncbi:MAG: FAD-NAD(P)-binding protein [Pseudomonadota bacterium]